MPRIESNCEPKLLLLGGGYTLGRLAERLDPRSFVITARKEAKLEQYRQAGYRAESVELSNLEQLEALFSTYPGLELLIDSVPPISGDPDQSAQGLNNLLRAAESSKLQRVIYLSTTGVFGVQDGSWVDEQTPPKPAHASGQARLLCEQAYRSSEYPTCVLRLPAIYGPGRGIKEALARGSYPLIKGERWSNRIHVDDLVSVLEILLKLDSTHIWPELLCVSDDCPAISREVVSFYCDRFGYAFPKELSLEEAKARGLTTLLSNQRITNKQMKKVLGIRLRYPSYREGADGATPFAGKVS